MNIPGEAGGTGASVVHIDDEDAPLAGEALQLIGEIFPPYDRHSLADLRSELAEKRLDLLSPFDFHLLAMVGQDGHAVAAASGIYLAGVNAGFITYLAVSPELRGQQLGHELRAHLVEAFRENARAAGREDLAFVLGEVRIDNPWLHSLVREGKAVPFHFSYFHPGMSPGAERRYVLYRQPVMDVREDLPATEVRKILYAVYRRAYRVRYPLERENFRLMLAELEGRERVGAHPEVLQLSQRD